MCLSVFISSIKTAKVSDSDILNNFCEVSFFSLGFASGIPWKCNFEESSFLRAGIFSFSLSSFKNTRARLLKDGFDFEMLSLSKG